MMRSFIVWLILGFTTGCSDTVTNRYETRADAEAANLFNHEWLPWIIPESSTQIITENNPTLNTSRGEFTFASHDRPAFISKLRKIDEQAIPQNQEQLRCWEKGYNPFSYKRYNSRWTFYIHPEKNHCRYWMEHIELTRSKATGPAAEPSSSTNEPPSGHQLELLETLKSLEEE